MKQIYTMVGTAEVGGRINTYTVIDNNYNIEEWKEADVIKHLNDSNCLVTNLGYNGKSVVATNGAIDKYARWDEEGQVKAQPRAVILNRIERGKKLIGYTVFMVNGTIKKLNIVDVVKIYNAGELANGKIRHTTSGDIISSINGDYPIMEVDIEKASTGTVTADATVICDVVAGGKVRMQYAGVYIHATSASKLSTIIERAFRTNKELVDTMRRVGGDKLADSMGIIRVAPTAYYGVVDMEALQYFKSDCKLNLGLSKDSKPRTMVSRIIMDKPMEYREMHISACDINAANALAELSGDEFGNDEKRAFLARAKEIIASLA